MAYLPTVNELTSDIQGGSGIAKTYNALTKNSLENQIKSAEAQYAPYTQYANALSKIAYANLLPYQIQATLMANPNLWQLTKNNPEFMKNLTQNLMKSVPSGGNVFGGVQIPTPGSSQGGILGNILNKLLNRGQQNPPQNIPTNPMMGNAGAQEFGQNNQASNELVDYISKNGNNNLNQNPQAQLPPLASPTSPVEQLGAYQTAKFKQLPVKGGIAYTTDKGDVVSPPTESTFSDIQKSFIGVNTALPVLKQIASEGQPFLEHGAKSKLNISKIAGLLDQYGLNVPDFILKKLGVDRKFISDYADWRANIEKAPESLMRAFNFPNDQLALEKIAKIVEPHPGETGKGYSDRVMREVNFLKKERLPYYQKVLGEGVPVYINPSNNKSGISAGAKILSNQIELPNFGSRKQFKDWYANQPKITQDAVKEYLRGRKK